MAEKDEKLESLTIKDSNGKVLNELYFTHDQPVLIENNPEKKGYDILQGCKNILISGEKVTCLSNEPPNIPNLKPKDKDQGRE